MMLEAIAHNHANRDNRKVPNLSYNLRTGGSERVWLSFESINEFIKIINLQFILASLSKTDLNSNSAKYFSQSW